MPPSGSNIHLKGKVSVSLLHAYCAAALKSAGFSDQDARVAADVMVMTDTWGIHTHGTKQLRPLLQLCPRYIDPRARPQIVAQGPAWGIMDGHNALAMVSSHEAMTLAIGKARSAGIAYVGLRNGNHFGAAAYYADMAREAGMIGLAMCNTSPLMTVPGSKAAVLGTNPIAYAVPAGTEPSLLFDIATSVVAGSKVIQAKKRGEKIPETWLVDADGVPTTDPSGFPEVGALIPMAAHKGYGIALLVEILGAVLPGAAMMSQVGVWIQPDPGVINQGHSFIAINARAMMPDGQFNVRMDHVIREIKNAPKAKGASRIYLPGEMEWEKRGIALREGIDLPDEVRSSLEGLARDWKLDLDDYFPIPHSPETSKPQARDET